MIRTVLFGAAGRMGKLVADEITAQKDISLVAAIEADGHPATGTLVGDVPITTDSDELPEADVLVDFSLADPVMKHLEVAARAGRSIIVGATGFSEGMLSEIRSLSKQTAILLAPNLSMGIGVMDKLTGIAADALGQDFQAGLFEIHHSTKRDAPSGTAKWLAEKLKTEDAEPQIVSLRLGGAIGEHRLHFTGSDEELIIIHRAWSRRAFARGVPRAIRFIYGRQPGLYSIRDIYNTI